MRGPCSAGNTRDRGEHEQKYGFAVPNGLATPAVQRKNSHFAAAGPDGALGRVRPEHVVDGRKEAPCRRVTIHEAVGELVRVGRARTLMP
jgi:hypothetical protein